MASEKSAAHRVVDEFTFEVALLFFRMRRAATQYLGQGRHATGRRSVLKSLGEQGPQTVPEMARVRSTSRQHVQKLVDVLGADGLVEKTPNPAHKRSMLIALTRRGEEFLATMDAREARLMEYLGRGIPLRELQTATDVVRELRERFESPEWERLAQDEREWRHSRRSDARPEL
jgi:DNA-binding MarR family transcriptional regulator